MRLRFEPDLVHQREALEAVLSSLRGGRVPEPPRLAVEMETGTGKTYVYLRLVHELHRRHGWRRFVVVVPSIAIREGVLSAIGLLEDHLARLYDGARIRPLAYHSRRIGDLREFALGPELQVLVMNIDAFNKDANLVRREHDSFHGQRPIDLIRSVRPVVLVDEPQRLGRRTARRAIDDLGPRVVIGWSATPPDRRELVYRLDPVRAFDLDLVKRIDVAAVEEGPRARVRAAVRIHLEREALARRIRPAGPRIKVLTLFFLARVADYADADGQVRRWFVEAWRDELESGRWDDLGLPAAHAVHGGYFARDRKGRAKDTGGRSRADRRAYELIMRDKTGLLDPDEPLRFVFSHSALREGWDNPNVFVVCALNEARGTVRRRQELGRGLRLPVDASGRRVRDPRLAVLTVVADEAYGRFAAGLQSEFEEDGHRLDAWRVRDHWERRRLEPGPGWRRLPALADLWRRLTRPVLWRPELRREELVTTAAAALGALPLPEPDGAPVPDLLGALADPLGLTRATVSEILSAAPGLDRLARCPGFVEAAVAALRAAVDGALAEHTRYVVRGAGRPLEELGDEVQVGYRSSLVRCERSIHGAIPVESERERALVERLTALDDLQVLVRLPPWLEIETPLGPFRPRLALARADRFEVVDDRPPESPASRAAARALEALGLELVGPAPGQAATRPRGRDR